MMHKVTKTFHQNKQLFVKSRSKGGAFLKLALLKMFILKSFK